MKSSFRKDLYRKMLRQCNTILIIARQPALITDAIKRKANIYCTVNAMQMQVPICISKRSGQISQSKSHVTLKLFQYANKLLSAEPLVLKLLKVRSCTYYITLLLLAIRGNKTVRKGLPGVAPWPQLSETSLFYPEYNFCRT